MRDIDTTRIANGTATCGTCALYQPPASGRWDAEGVCRRYAPVIVVLGPVEDRWTEATQPGVSADDVCGEWLARDEAISR